MGKKTSVRGKLDEDELSSAGEARLLIYCLTHISQPTCQKITSVKNQTLKEGLVIVIQEVSEIVVSDLQSCQKLSNG